MSKTLALELPDEVYNSVSRAAEAAGRDAPEWIASNLPRLLPFLQEPIKQEAWAPAMTVHPEICPLLETVAAQTGKPLDRVIAEFKAECRPEPRPQLTEQEREAGRARFHRFCGAIDSGDPHSADNERIDEDLAREYGSTHEDEA